MIKIKVAAAAFAAGMMTFAAVAQPRAATGRWFWRRKPPRKRAQPRRRQRRRGANLSLSDGLRLGQESPSAGAKAWSPNAGKPGRQPSPKAPAVPAKRKKGCPGPEADREEEEGEPGENEPKDAKTASVSKSPRPKLVARARLRPPCCPASRQACRRARRRWNGGFRRRCGAYRPLRSDRQPLCGLLRGSGAACPRGDSVESNYGSTRSATLARSD